ncbi:VPS4-associated protein 1 [Circinella umbellata]|nr:VPS4-associated protein 1 [Circinella umbellata]
MSERIQNLYVARLTTNERPCFICNKFTAVVLTLADNSNHDWFYICRSHLGDTNFCSRVGGSAAGNKSVPSSPRTKKQFEDRPPESDSVSDLVASIGSAWNSWRKKPSENEDDKKKDDDNKKKKSDNDDDQKDTKSDDDKKQENHKDVSDSVPTSPKSPQQPVRFVLNKDYFYMRQREYTRKIQKKEANNKLKTLDFPEVPKTHPK